MASLLDTAAFAQVDDSAIRASARLPDARMDPRGVENMAVLAQQKDTYGFWMTDIAQRSAITENPLTAEATEFRTLWQMLRDGCSADTIGGFGETPLLRTNGGDSWTALLLLRFGANPNFRCGTYGHTETYGGTALHAASKRGNVPMVVALLNAGANPAVLDGYGLTPAAAALAGGDGEHVSNAYPNNSSGPSQNQSVAAAAITKFVLGQNARVDIHAGTLEEAHAAVLAAVQELG